MSIEPASPVSLLDSVLTAERTQLEWQTAVQVRAKDTMEEMGSAIVALIEATVAPPAQQPPALDQLA